MSFLQKDYARVVVLYDSLLGFHMGEVDLFIKAARFLIKYVKDIDLARKTLFKGIRIHRRNHLLYLEFFKIELDFALKKRRECQEGNNSTLCLCLCLCMYMVILMILFLWYFLFKNYLLLHFFFTFYFRFGEAKQRSGTLW